MGITININWNGEFYWKNENVLKWEYGGACTTQ